MSSCPCQSGKGYHDCCEPVIAGAVVPTIEGIVRARYAAFAVKNLDYVERTHAPEIRDDFNRAEAERLAEECQWDGLYIHKIRDHGDTAEVEYVARVIKDHKVHAKGVLSSFRKDAEQWIFVSSKPFQQIAHLRGPKLGRNDPCFCHSGQKYKKCHGSGNRELSMS